MYNFDVIKETFFFKYNFDESFSKLKLYFAIGNEEEVCINLTEVVHFEFSRSYKDGGPGYLVYYVDCTSEEDKIIAFLTGKYGFINKDGTPALVDSINYKLLSIEGDVTFKIVFEDFDISHPTPFSL